MPQADTPGRFGRQAARATFVPGAGDVFRRHAHHRDRGLRAIAFIENECTVPAGRGMGKPYRLLPHQKRDLRAILSDPDVLVGIISAPRGWGKTGIIAPLLVWALFDQEGAQVLAAATGLRTARLPYDRAVRIIEANPELSDEALIYRNAAAPYVELPHRGATLAPLPAEERHIVGMSPTLVIVDEIGYVTPATYETMQTSLGKVDGAILLGIGTPGLGVMDGTEPNLMWTLRELSRSDTPPPGLRYLEYSADPGADPSKLATWRQANPALGRLVDPRAVANDYATMPLSRFGQMRLGLWTQHESAWMPQDAWDGLQVQVGPPAEGATLTLGFDGSASGDTTALVAYEPASSRLAVLGYWERPQGPEGKGWSVPRADVTAAVEYAMSHYHVMAMLADPWGWRESLQAWAQTWGTDRVLEYNTAHSGRMAPATDAFRTAVILGELAHDGHPALRAHVLAAVAKVTPAGDVIVKDARRPQYIDLAVAAILAKEAARSVESAPAIY